MSQTSSTVVLRGLPFHVRRTAAKSTAHPRTVVLVHGFADATRTWDPVARGLSARGFDVIGYDQRGFGETGWASNDGYYHFMDYVADLDALLSHLKLPDVAIVGHSMGGTVCSLYAGAKPKSLSRLVLLEGLGPPDSDPTYAPDRATQWLADLATHPREKDRTYKTREEALVRLQKQHGKLSRELLESHLDALVLDVEGGVRWRMDPLHRTTSPMPFYAATYCGFARRITCPVTLVHGGKDGFHPADESERIATFSNAREVTLDGAGHMMHWTMPEALAGVIADSVTDRS